MANISTTTVTQGQDTYFYREALLRRGERYLLYDQFGSKLPFKAREGNNLTKRRHEHLSVATTPVTEGTLPAEAVISYTDYTATLEQYLNWVEITDIASTTSLENLRAEYADILGKNKGRTLDIIYRDLLLGGTSVYYADGVAGRTTVDTPVEEADLQAIDRALFTNEAEYFEEMTKGDQKYATTPIRPCYWVVCHVDNKKDLENLTGYQSVEMYAGQTATKTSEFGAWGNFRFVGSQNCRYYNDATNCSAIGASGMKTDDATYVNTYMLLVFGQDAYSYCPLEALNVDLIEHGFGDAGAYDPGNQLMTMAWKAYTTLLIHNDNWMYRYEVCATA